LAARPLYHDGALELFNAVIQVRRSSTALGKHDWTAVTGTGAESASSVNAAQQGNTTVMAGREAD